MQNKKLALSGGTIFFSAITLFAVGKLVFNEFPSKANLATVYFIYAFALLITVHMATFWIRLELIERRGRGLSKNTPRYIDYCVTLLISIGLFQIYFSDESIAKYITKVGGARDEILTEIRSTARKYIEQDCQTNSDPVAEVCRAIGISFCSQNQRFSDDFCKKTAEIYKHPDLGKYIIENLSKDQNYLSHAVGFIPYEGGVHPVYSPIRAQVNRFMAIGEYSVAPADPESKFALNWISIILLPAVIALRFLKTSVEIFGQLER